MKIYRSISSYFDNAANFVSQNHVLLPQVTVVCEHNLVPRQFNLVNENTKCTWVGNWFTSYALVVRIGYQQLRKDPFTNNFFYQRYRRTYYNSPWNQVQYLSSCIAVHERSTHSLLFAVMVLTATLVYDLEVKHCCVDEACPTVLA